MTHEELRALALDCKNYEIDFDDISPNQGSTSCDKLVRHYIAAASPDVVLGLLDENERLKADLVKHRDLLITHLSVIDPLRDDNAALRAEIAARWLPIESVPKGESVLLYCNKYLPIYCGRKRYGNLGEPQQDVSAWRCDSSGRFANPTHWMPLPPAPGAKE